MSIPKTIVAKKEAQAASESHRCSASVSSESASDSSPRPASISDLQEVTKIALAKYTAAQEQASASRDPSSSPTKDLDGTAVAVVSPDGKSKAKLGKLSEPNKRERRRPRNALELKMELRRMEAKIQKGARLELDLLNKAAFVRKKRQAMTLKYKQMSKLMMKMAKESDETIDFVPAKLPPVMPSRSPVVDLTGDC